MNDVSTWLFGGGILFRFLCSGSGWAVALLLFILFPLLCLWQREGEFRK